MSIARPPHGLVEASIGQIAEVYTGATPSRTEPKHFGGGIPWVTTTEVRGHVITATAQTLSESGRRAARCKIFPVGSIVIAMYGQGATRGRSAVLGVEAATNQACAVLLPSPRYETRFLWHYLRASYDRLRDLGRGGNQPNLNLNMVREFSVPLPSLSEQRRIADILDKADAIRRKRKEAIALTEELLRSAFLEMFGDPVTNPKGWAVKPLGELADAASGVTKGKRYEGSTMVTLPYMRVANVQDGHLVLDEVKTITVSEEDGRRYQLKDGDVLLTEGGDPDKLGRGTVWRGEVENCIHQNHIFRVRPAPQIRAEYLAAIVGSARGKRYFLSAAKQTTGIATINMTQLRAFPVLLPPLQLQDAYVDFIQSAAKLRATYRQKHDLVDDLFGALMSRAFSGALSHEARQ